jgi:hypothetical protein
LIQNTCPTYDEPHSTGQNLCAEVLVGSNVDDNQAGTIGARFGFLQNSAPLSNFRHFKSPGTISLGGRSESALVIIRGEPWDLCMAELMI